MEESTINYINRIESDLAKLKLKLKESPITEEPMLECTDGDWILDRFLVRQGISTDDYRKIGTKFETAEEATEARKQCNQQAIINNHAIRLNKKDGFVADWKKINQTKCYMAFSHYHNMWVINFESSTKQTGAIAISFESAKYLKEKLNKGLITGVNADGDI